MDYSPIEKKIMQLTNRDNMKNFSKGEIVEIYSHFEDFKPEIQKMIIEKLPEMGKIANNMVVELNKTAQDITRSNDDSSNKCFEIYNKVLNDYSKCLDDENLTFDQKMEIIDKEMGVIDKAEKLDDKNKKFNWGTLKDTALIVLATVAVGAVALGVKAKKL